MVSSTIKTALGEQVVRARWVGWLDIATDPLRATSGLYDKTFSGTGDADLDGFTFQSLNHDLVSVSEVQHRETGAESVKAALSGLIVNNSGLLTLIGTRANWQGRAARLWWYLVDGNEAQIGEVVPYYTGYMSEISIAGSSDGQTIVVEIESYLASLAEASGKTYLMQAEFDAGDLSAQASIAVANGTSGAGAAAAGGGGGIMIGGARVGGLSKLF